MSAYDCKGIIVDIVLHWTFSGSDSGYSSISRRSSPFIDQKSYRNVKYSTFAAERANNKWKTFPTNLKIVQLLQTRADEVRNVTYWFGWALNVGLRRIATPKADSFLNLRLRCFPSVPPIVNNEESSMTHATPSFESSIQGDKVPPAKSLSSGCAILHDSFLRLRIRRWYRLLFFAYYLTYLVVGIIFVVVSVVVCIEVVSGEVSPVVVSNLQCVITYNSIHKR